MAFELILHFMWDIFFSCVYFMGYGNAIIDKPLNSQWAVAMIDFLVVGVANLSVFSRPLSVNA